MTPLEQHKEVIKKANKITNRKTLYAAGAGLIPIPIVDTATLLGVQLTMIQSIAKLYDIPFKKHIAQSLIGSLISSLGSVSLIKLIPGIGTVVGGATASISGAASTYALGRIFTQHFDQGGTLLDFDPITSREYFHQEYEAGRLFVAGQNLADEGGEDGGNAGLSEKEKLLRETNELQAIVLQLQADIDLLEKNKKKIFTAIDPEQLTIVEGIGPKTAAALKAGGVSNLTDLSNTSAEKIRQLLDEADGNFKLSDPSTWPKQASLAVEGKLAELKAWQEELFGGRTRKQEE